MTIFGIAQRLNVSFESRLKKIAFRMNTRTVQSIGGNEALNKPYLAISLARMFRKRGGRLTGYSFYQRNAHGHGDEFF
ncbi:MAG: hypothetical protein PVH37_29635 [Desulfobacterales bacterium]|jgi:exonuclease I